MQYTKLYKRFDMATNPAVVVSKVLFPQSSIMAALVHSHNILLSDVFPYLQTYSIHNVTQFIANSVRSLHADPISLLSKLSNSQHTAVDHKVRHPRCVYNKLDWSVYICLTQLYGGRDIYI